MKTPTMNYNLLSAGLKTLQNTVFPFRIYQIMFTFFIAVSVLSCTDSVTDNNEENECQSEECALRITTTSLPDGEVGTEYSETLSATGGDGNYLWEIDPDDLPQGLNLNSSTGEISGDPTEDGSFTFTARVSSAGMTDSKSLGIQMVPPVVVSYKNTVVNMDFMFTDGSDGDEVYVGDDGVLSSTDGKFWNSANTFYGRQFTSIVDEFEQPTFVDMTADFKGEIFIGSATNNLQDLGGIHIGEGGVEWKGLLADSGYELAIYVYHQNALLSSTTLDVTHAGGTITLSTSGDTTWVLPGENGQDYLLLENAYPYEISDGVYGFRIDNLNEKGVIVGLQLKGLVPAPAN